jgi:hypothetical protein
LLLYIEVLDELFVVEVTQLIEQSEVSGVEVAHGSVNEILVGSEGSGSGGFGLGGGGVVGGLGGFPSLLVSSVEGLGGSFVSVGSDEFSGSGGSSGDHSGLVFGGGFDEGSLSIVGGGGGSLSTRDRGFTSLFDLSLFGGGTGKGSLGFSKGFLGSFISLDGTVLFTKGSLEFGLGGLGGGIGGFGDLESGSGSLSVSEVSVDGFGSSISGFLGSSDILGVSILVFLPGIGRGERCVENNLVGCGALLVLGGSGSRSGSGESDGLGGDGEGGDLGEHVE